MAAASIAASAADDVESWSAALARVARDPAPTPESASRAVRGMLELLKVASPEYMREVSGGSARGSNQAPPMQTANAAQHAPQPGGAGTPPPAAASSAFGRTTGGVTTALPPAVSTDPAMEKARSKTALQSGGGGAAAASAVAAAAGPVGGTAGASAVGAAAAPVASGGAPNPASAALPPAAARAAWALNDAIDSDRARAFRANKAVTFRRSGRLPRAFAWEVPDCPGVRLRIGGTLPEAGRCSFAVSTRERCSTRTAEDHPSLCPEHARALKIEVAKLLSGLCSTDRQPLASMTSTEVGR